MKLLHISTSVEFHTEESLSSSLSTEDSAFPCFLSTILNASQIQTRGTTINGTLTRSLLLSSSLTSRVTRGTLATTQVGEEAEEEVEAGKEEDGDEKDHASKLWVILKVQEGITSGLA